MTRRADPRTKRQLVPRGQLPSFSPVPRNCERHDGWTAERQCDFIEALADTGSVSAACKVVNMSQPGAYYLRRQKGAESFRDAWQRALDLGVQRLEDVAMDRALNGVELPVYSYGKLVGTRRAYNDRLLMFLLRNRAPERFGKNGSALKGLNAIGKMEKRRLKKKWRARFREEWEAEHAAKHDQVSVEDLRQSITEKVEGIREKAMRRRAEEWAQFSEETRAAWDEFERLRNRDLERLGADKSMRRRHYEGPSRDTASEPQITPNAKLQ